MTTIIYIKSITYTIRINLNLKARSKRHIFEPFAHARDLILARIGGQSFPNAQVLSRTISAHMRKFGFDNDYAGGLNNIEITIIPHTITSRESPIDKP